MNVAWSEQAKTSLAKIYDYIYQDSPEEAENVLNTLLIKAESLNDPRVEYPKDPIVDNQKYRFILQWNLKLFMREPKKK